MSNTQFGTSIAKQAWIRLILAFILASSLLAGMLSGLPSASANDEEKAQNWRVGAYPYSDSKLTHAYLRLTHPEEDSWVTDGYCLNKTKTVPGFYEEYPYSVGRLADRKSLGNYFTTPRKDNRELAAHAVVFALYHGYPMDASKKREEFGLTEDEASFATQRAIHWWTDWDKTEDWDDTKNIADYLQGESKVHQHFNEMMKYFQWLTDERNFLLYPVPNDVDIVVGNPKGEKADEYQAIVALILRERVVDVEKHDQVNTDTKLDNAGFTFTRVSEKTDPVLKAYLKANSNGITDRFQVMNFANKGTSNYFTYKVKTGANGHSEKDVKAGQTWTTDPVEGWPAIVSGLYKLEETTAPSGYQAMQPAYIWIKPSGQAALVSAENGNFKEVQREDIKINSEEISTGGFTTHKITFSIGDDSIPAIPQLVKFRKVDESGNRLDSASFTITNTTDSADVQTINSSKTVDIEKSLKPGTYILKETASPVGYKTADAPVTFTVTPQGEIQLKSPFLSIYSLADENKTLVIKNEKIPAGKDVKVRFSKFADGQLGKELPGATLAIYEGEHVNQVPDSAKRKETWESGQAKDVTLAAGVYTFVETKAPQGYGIAKNIVFKIADGKAYLKAENGKWIEWSKYAVAEAKPLKAYSDFMDDTYSWGTTPYGKNYYIDRKSDSSSTAGDEVIYCFNISLKQPTDSYDYGDTVDPDGFNPAPTYTAKYGKDMLLSYASNPKIKDPEKFADAIQRVLYAGYPNNKKNLQNGISDTAFRTVTQLAIYNFTDSFDLKALEKATGQDQHGFGGILEPQNKQIKEVYEKLIEFANSNKPMTDPVDVPLYVPSNNKFQSFVGTLANKPELIPVVEMIDKEKPAVVTGSVKISKLVAGEFGDREQEFDFFLRVNPNPATGITAGQTFTAKKYNAQGEQQGTEIAVKAAAAGTETTPVKLKHGEYAVVENIPVGTAVISVSEKQEPGYILTVTENSAVHNDPLNDTNYDVTENQQTKIVFTNTRDITPTGVNTSLLPYLLALGLTGAAGSIWLLALVRRRNSTRRAA
ncbi:Cys-Gln thioester bond-forming surface protein [Arcanobacterium hippocoleae]